MGLLGNLSLGSLFGAADKFVGGAIDHHYNKKKYGLSGQDPRISIS